MRDQSTILGMISQIDIIDITKIPLNDDYVKDLFIIFDCISGMPVANQDESQGLKKFEKDLLQVTKFLKAYYSIELMLEMKNKSAILKICDSIDFDKWLFKPDFNDYEFAHGLVKILDCISSMRFQNQDELARFERVEKKLLNFITFIAVRHIKCETNPLYTIEFIQHVLNIFLKQEKAVDDKKFLTLMHWFCETWLNFNHLDKTRFNAKL